MTRLVDGLQHDGYVRRSPDPDDARAVLVEATDRGVQALREARRRRIVTFSSMLAGLSRRDLTQLARGVDALERAMASEP
jgi:DNA-binding MarR family transcriptional regulator